MGVCVGGERFLPFFPVARFELQREGVHHFRPPEVGHILYGTVGKEAEPGLKVGDSEGENSGIGLDQRHLLIKELERERCRAHRRPQQSVARFELDKAVRLIRAAC